MKVFSVKLQRGMGLLTKLIIANFSKGALLTISLYLLLTYYLLVGSLASEFLGSSWKTYMSV